MIAPMVKESVTGAADTARMVRLRWDALRSTRSRAFSVVAVVLVCVGVISAANMGLAVKFMAMQGLDSAAGIFARSWILSLERNEIGDIGAITLGGAVIAAVFAPFTGSATVSVIPADDLSTVRPARLHRYFDSLLINAFSGIGLLQLFALTGIASVLTIEGNHSVALTVTWLIWVSVIVLTSTIGWTLEWLTRTYGKYARLTVAATLVAVVAVLSLRDPLEIRRLFGLGAAYAKWMKEASLTGEFLTPAAAITVLTVLLLIAGLAATRAALNRPAPAANTARNRRAPQGTYGDRATVIALLTNSIYRTVESRRPILAILLLGVPAVLFLEVTSSVENALMMAVPLAVSLAWGVNLFGLFGQAMPWLVTQPRIPDLMFKYAFYVQAALVALLVMFLLSLAALRGNASPQVAFSVLCGGVAAGALSSAVSLRLAVKKPMRAVLTGRGDALVPPVTALGYLLLLLVTACAPAAVIATALPLWAKAPATIAAVAAALLIQNRSQRIWSHPTQRSAVTAAVAAN